MAKNTNCKKAWHPSRFEHKAKIEKYKKAQEDKGRAKRILMMKRMQEKKLKRFDWMHL